MATVDELIERVRELRYARAVYIHLAEYLAQFLPTDAGSPVRAISVTDGPLEPVPQEMVEEIQEILMETADKYQHQMRGLLALPVHEKGQSHEQNKKAHQKTKKDPQAPRKPHTKKPAATRVRKSPPADI